MPRIYTHEWVILRFSGTLRPPVYQLSYCQLAVAPRPTSQLYSQTLVWGCKMKPATKGSSKEQLCTPALTMHWNRMSRKREDSGRDFACSPGAISYPSLIPPEIDRSLISSGDACDCLLWCLSMAECVHGMEWCVNLDKSSMLFELDYYVSPGPSSDWMPSCHLPSPWQGLQWFLSHKMTSK